MNEELERMRAAWVAFILDWRGAKPSEVDMVTEDANLEFEGTLLETPRLSAFKYAWQTQAKCIAELEGMIRDANDAFLPTDCDYPLNEKLAKLFALVEDKP